MEYYSATKGNGIMALATTWAELKDVMGSKPSQAQEDKRQDSRHVRRSKQPITERPRIDSWSLREQEGREEQGGRT